MLNVSVKKRLVQHHTAPILLPGPAVRANSTGAVHFPMCSTRRFHELVSFHVIFSHSSLLRSVFRPFDRHRHLVAASCSFRSCSSSLSWSSRQFYISGKHPSFTMQPNSAVETSLRLSRAQSSEHWRLSSSDPMPQPFVRVAVTQPKGEKFFLVSNER